MDFLVAGLGFGALLVIVGFVVRDIGPLLRRPRADSAHPDIDRDRWTSLCHGISALMMTGGGVVVVSTIVATALGLSDGAGNAIVLVVSLIVVAAIVVGTLVHVRDEALTPLATGAAPRSAARPATTQSWPSKNEEPEPISDQAMANLPPEPAILEPSTAAAVESPAVPLEAASSESPPPSVAEPPAIADAETGDSVTALPPTNEERIERQFEEFEPVPGDVPLIASLPEIAPESVDSEAPRESADLENDESIEIVAEPDKEIHDFVDFGEKVVEIAEVHSTVDLPEPTETVDDVPREMAILPEDHLVEADPTAPSSELEPELPATEVAPDETPDLVNTAELELEEIEVDPAPEPTAKTSVPIRTPEAPLGGSFASPIFAGIGLPVSGAEPRPLASAFDSALLDDPPPALPSAETMAQTVSDADLPAWDQSSPLLSDPEPQEKPRKRWR